MSRSLLVRIGLLAREANVPVSTIHYYMKQGLLQPAGRTSGGNYLFNPESALPQLKRIQELQKQERLTLVEIRERFNKEEEV